MTRTHIQQQSDTESADEVYHVIIGKMIYTCAEFFCIVNVHVVKIDKEMNCER